MCVAFGIALGGALLLFEGESPGTSEIVTQGTPPTLDGTTPTGVVPTTTGTTSDTLPIDDQIDVILAGLPLANLAFNSPQVLHLETPAVIQLRLSAEETAAELEEQITELGEKVRGRVKYTGRMEASLIGINFEIQPITPTEQAVGSEGVTEWRWEVEPTETGSQRLHLTLSAVIVLGAEETRYTVSTFERTLAVEVTWGDRLMSFLGENWQFVLTVVLIPIGIQFFRWWKQSHGKPGAGPRGGDAGRRHDSGA